MRSITWLTLGCLWMSAAPVSAHALDRDALTTEARAIRARVSAGSLDPLWARFTPRMQQVLHDSTTFSATGAMIHGQIGTIDSVMSEEVTVTDTSLTLSSSCRVSRVPIPMNVIIALTADQHIAGLLVRPDAAAAKEYPSAYLDYVPTTHFSLPVRGEWFCGWGGRTLAENRHAMIRAQRFAYDLMIRHDGVSHRGDGKALTDYYCYGEPVLAPADGIVVTALDSLPDQAIGAHDALHAAGNHVVIDHGHDEYTLLAHMKPGSVRVKPGQKVKRGDVLGLAGNSGNTSEPHLHVHLMNKPSMDDADGLPLPFADFIADGVAVPSGELKRGQVVAPRARAK